MDEGQIKETNVSEKDKLERDALSLSAGSKRASTSMSRSHKTIMRNIKTVVWLLNMKMMNRLLLVEQHQQVIQRNDDDNEFLILKNVCE